MTATLNTTNIKIGKFEQEFILVETTAPKAYDYGYCIEVETYEASGKRDAVRFVLVPVENLEYQMGRYMSGCFGATVMENPGSYMWDWVLETLYARLRG